MSLIIVRSFAHNIIRREKYASDNDVTKDGVVNEPEMRLNRLAPAELPPEVAASRATWRIGLPRSASFESTARQSSIRTGS
jgi:hypothetical protein